MWSDTSGTTVLCPLSHIKGKKVVISRKGRKAFSHFKSKGSIQFVLSRWEQGLISRRSLHIPNHPNSWMCYISNLKSSPACIKSNKFWGATEVSLQLLSTIQQAFCWETSNVQHLGEVGTLYNLRASAVSRESWHHPGKGDSHKPTSCCFDAESWKLKCLFGNKVLFLEVKQESQNYKGATEKPL